MTDPLENMADYLQLDQVNGLIAAAGVDGLREILEAFWRSTASLLEGLTAQAQGRSYDEAAQTAHAIKGSAANIGAQRLADIATEVEDACRSQDDQKLDACVTAIHNDFDAVRVLFDAHLAAAAA